MKINVLIILILCLFLVPLVTADIITQSPLVNITTNCANFYGENNGTTPQTVWFEYNNHIQGGMIFKTQNKTNIIGTFSDQVCGFPLISTRSYIIRAVGDNGIIYEYGDNQTFTMPTMTPHNQGTSEKRVDTFMSYGGDPFSLFTVVIWSEYTGLLGGIFFGVILFFMASNLAIKQKNIGILSILLICVGISLWQFMPTEFLIFGQMLIITSFAGILYFIFSKRR